MANMLKNLDLFHDEPDAWRKAYWAQKNKNKDQVGEMAERINSASVKTVKTARDKEKESADFFKAQQDITKDVLPEQTMAEKNTMKMTPTEAFIEVYPHGNSVPTSPATKPTSSIAEYPTTGYCGNDGVPQGQIGTLMLDVKGNTSKWIGNHYLPKETQNNQVEFVPPKTQISAWDAKVFDDGGCQVQGTKCNKDKAQANIGTNIGNLIEKILTERNMNTVIDMSASIASTKEKRVLYKPFKTANGSSKFAVYAKDDNGKIWRVGFGSECANCETSGPKWKPNFWACKMQGAAKASSPEKTVSSPRDVAVLNDEKTFLNRTIPPTSPTVQEAPMRLKPLSDYYYEKPVMLDPNEDWDGYTFYSEDDILKSMPDLRNVEPCYDDENVRVKGAGTFSDSKINPERQGELQDKH